MTALPQSSVKFPRKVHHVWTGGGGAGLGELASRALPSQVSAERRMPLGQG